MNQSTEYIISQAMQLGLSHLAHQAASVIERAEEEHPGYGAFAGMLLSEELLYRQNKQQAIRIKAARLPLNHDLDYYDPSFENGLKPEHLNQLKELNWLDQNYNIILTGPSGTGKTFISSGLCYQAIKNGYRAYFRTMEHLMDTLRMKDVARSAAVEYKKLCKAQLMVIDDIMLFPIGKIEATKLFSFINQVFETTSFIITTNKAPAEWAQLLDDEVLATALLDRLLCKCQLIPLEGDSHRMLNRTSIF